MDRWRIWLSVFPTCVGVFPITVLPCKLGNGLPHVRGGVSIRQGLNGKGAKSSPRAWGCFLQCAEDMAAVQVFPTCVGGFLFKASMAIRNGGLPHVRGGGAISVYGIDQTRMSSPRAWGCFRLAACKGGESHVFPTCVGVFLLEVRRDCLIVSLPHVRGGVSIIHTRQFIDSRSSPRPWGCFYMFSSLGM